MGVSKVQAVGAMLGVMLGGCVLAAPASATQIYIKSASIGPYESATISGGLLGTKTEDYTGQQLDTVNLGSTYNPNTSFQVGLWCVDINDDIVLGGDYVYTLAPLGSVTSNPPVTWTTPVKNEISWLAFYGNKHLANYTSADIASYGTPSQFSAAVQVAIWNTEYGSSYTGSDSQVASDLLTLAEAWNNGHPAEPATGGVSYALINRDGAQALDTYLLTFSGIPAADLPEPVSLAVLGSGLFGLAALRRRRAA